jgi:hypothetical protein
VANAEQRTRRAYRRSLVAAARGIDRRSARDSWTFSAGPRLGRHEVDTRPSTQLPGVSGKRPTPTARPSRTSASTSRVNGIRRHRCRDGMPRATWAVGVRRCGTRTTWSRWTRTTSPRGHRRRRGGRRHPNVKEVHVGPGGRVSVNFFIGEGERHVHELLRPAGAAHRHGTASGLMLALAAVGSRSVTAPRVSRTSPTPRW